MTMATLLLALRSPSHAFSHLAPSARTTLVRPALVFPQSTLDAHAAPRAAEPILSHGRSSSSLQVNAQKASRMGLVEASDKDEVSTTDLELLERFFPGASKWEKETQVALKTVLTAFAASSAFLLGVGFTRGLDDASSWLGAYVLEESLSVDNLLVFTLIFNYFKTPPSAQPRVLKWGFAAAIVLRLAFIAGGLALVQQFKGTLLVFAGVLVYSAYGLLTGEEDEEEDLSQNVVVQTAKRFLKTSDTYDGSNFFTRAPGSLNMVATPLLLALVCVEISDVIFAVDSIPAVFGITTDPFIAFTSNCFALLSLRALYTLVSQGLDDFEYLQPAIALVLGFIGFKLIGSFAGYELSTELSLAVVVITIGSGIMMSPTKAQAGEAAEEPLND